MAPRGGHAGRVRPPAVPGPDQRLTQHLTIGQRLDRLQTRIAELLLWVDREWVDRGGRAVRGRAHRFADLSEPGFGVALLNDGRYGHHAHGAELGISLLRSPIWPDPPADAGEQPASAR
ncbi:MAG TPA: glycoside hydrolase family 38 C-terminal domain-containing protein [Solirubrobacteraceae bacterium]|nr:glycoside hydrolase family 38 C-terminal domain-containing protein [Solirubrobacteraceae bacterium]